MSIESRPISEPSRKFRDGAGCVRLFAIPFILVGAVFFYVMTLGPLLGVFRARSWQATPCKVLSSSVETHSDSDGDTYRVRITYAYRVNDRRYESDRYDFSIGSSSGYEGKARVVRQYPAGSAAVCYVNPADPAQAVLDRKPGAMIWFGAFSLIFVAVGLFVFIRAPQMSNSRKQSGPVSGVSTAHRNAALPGGATAEGVGPTVLRATTSPLGKLVGMSFFALFWNGVVSVFVWQIVKSFRRGHPEWFLTIFMIPFEVIGIGALIGVFYTLLALFNPRPRLIVSRTAIPLGEGLDIQWEFTGKSTRIRKLRITIEGVEEATYTRGTNTSTDRSVFVELPVVDETDPGVIRSGDASCSIPTDLMHSFDGGNNKIIWGFRVRGEIPRFPDVDADFPLTVLPRSVAAPLASV